MIDTETLALDQELNTIEELRTQVHRLERALTRERGVASDWKRQARKWEDRAKQRDAGQPDAEHWKAKEREARTKSHTWRLLYQDLLEKIGRKLDLEGELY